MFIAIDSRVDERVLVIHLDATIPAFTVALAFFLLAPVPILKAKLDDDNDFLMTFINILLQSTWQGDVANAHAVLLSLLLSTLKSIWD